MIIAGIGIEFRTKSVKRTAEKIRESGSYHSAVRFTDYKPFCALPPAVNCWATTIRPLCGLIDSESTFLVI